jgi:CheY-like chemotaxis protein
MFEHQAKAKGTTIQLLMGADAHNVRNGDMVRIKQAISNLVRNAIIHSRGTEIVINFSSKKSATTRETLSVWSISDNGIGISEEEVDRLFEPFERGSKDARNQADGSGLGLFIVKSSIEALEGNVSFFRPEAGGAGYLIEVPEPVNTKLNNELSKQHATPKESEKFPHLRIILAEDNQLVADVTQARLLNFVGKVEVAQNGREALDQIIANPPDMVITDLFMPEMDGDELIRTLRARGYTKPIIGLTAAVVGDEMEQLRQAGADHAMSKPIDFRALLAIITEMHLPA